ncbi:uncharacterized protein LOC131510726 [Neofelis nebulosa]|uniref:uncharacterized protein LOC131510726 n=1 Tax=Neofelis nebulosa TaxID=61452 RepID=UPI00272C3B45|nr:uncharacterized protein LOC131510726 [Neofelis nebulosa]
MRELLQLALTALASLLLGGDEKSLRQERTTKQPFPSSLGSCELWSPAGRSQTKAADNLSHGTRCRRHTEQGTGPAAKFPTVATATATLTALAIHGHTRPTSTKAAVPTPPSPGRSSKISSGRPTAKSAAITAPLGARAATDYRHSTDQPWRRPATNHRSTPADRRQPSPLPTRTHGTHSDRQLATTVGDDHHHSPPPPRAPTTHHSTATESRLPRLPSPTTAMNGHRPRGLHRGHSAWLGEALEEHCSVDSFDTLPGTHRPLQEAVGTPGWKFWPRGWGLPSVFPSVVLLG